MTRMMNFFKLFSAYTIITIFSVSVFVLLAIIVHLIHEYQQKHKNEAKQKRIRNFMLITLAAVIFFEITLLLVIAVCAQIIMIDGHSLHQDVDWMDRIYYESFEYMEYLIAICDTSAHLCVIFVFISRYHHTFHNSTIFDHGSAVVRALYACAWALTVFGGVIVILICVEHTVTEIIVLEIVWEILVDFMCLWILYLFLSKLYLLLKMSVQAHMKSGGKTDFVKELIEATKASVERSKSSNRENSKGSKGSKGSKKSSKWRRHKSRSPEPKSMMTMTIDGMKVDPIKPLRSTPRGASPKPALPDSPCPSPSPDPSAVTVHKHVELTVTKAMSDHDHTDNDTDHDHTDHEMEAQNGGMKGESAAMDLIGVMTKMTILVTFTVLVSVIGVVGNVFIEIQELKHIEKHDIATEELVADILPVVDIVITSLMLYLQFNFTQTLYRKVLGRFDVWFLMQCLKCIESVWKRKHNSDEFTTSFIIETNSTKTLETAPQSTQTDIIR